ncbi:MAG: hypothetical protein WCF88_11225 [Candidatus Acidiferrales bacterium]|jgi:hypothetical protein
MDDKETLEVLRAILKAVEQLGKKIDDIGFMIGDYVKRSPQLPRR